jgi:tRNA-splicing ligase RtcB (3'-phosphate/5'-hydroxy nucleic acid ligase)
MSMSKDQKKLINKLCKENQVPPSQVFNYINERNAGFDEALRFINKLVGLINLNKKDSIYLGDSCPYIIHGESLIHANAIQDFLYITQHPEVQAARLMADGHRVGEKKMPVGAVAFSKTAIFPDFVSSDIACSVHLTITNCKVDDDFWKRNRKTLRFILKTRTMFGQEINSDSSTKLASVFQREPVLKTTEGYECHLRVRDNAVTQLGTSGDGNHFVEFGEVDGKFAIMSHFGSRGIGADIARLFQHIAEGLFDEKSKGLAYLPLYSDYGNDYIEMMNWAGHFADDSHDWLHNSLMKCLNDRGFVVSPTKRISSKHNFATLEEFNGEMGYVHRKGATPAHKDQLGVIPATMAHPAKIVKGLGNETFMNSASHGGGRLMSRSQSQQQNKNVDLHEYMLEKYGIVVVGADRDELPNSYKDINEVMKEQVASVQVIGEFYPKFVRMADPRVMRKR